MRQQLPALTSLRGIAAFGVLLYHLRASLADLPLPFVVQGYMWVDLFFVLSGFIIAYTYGADFADGFLGDRYRAFLWARLARIYPLHLFVLLVLVTVVLGRWYLIARYGVHVKQPEPFAGERTLPGLASQVLMLQALGPFGTEAWNFPAWSISAEFLVYLVFPWLFAVATGRPRILFGAAAVACIAWPLMVSRPQLEFYYLPLRALGEFSAGCLTYLAYRSEALPFLGGDRVAVLLLACVVVGQAVNLPIIVFVVLFCALVLAAARSKGTGLLSAAPLMWLGEISYSLYLTQMPIIDTVDQALRGLHFSPVEPLVLAPVIMIVVLAVSTLTYRFIENPARRWLRTLVPALASPTGPERKPA
jgi:peptidoglycan/LPS O-acetylase OafA/YrhL